MQQVDRNTAVDVTELRRNFDSGVQTKFAYTSPTLTPFGDIRSVTMSGSGKTEEEFGGDYRP